MSDVTSGRGGSDFVEGRHRRHLVGDGVPDGTDAVCLMAGEGRRRWMVTGYEAARDVLRDRRFSRAELAAEVHPRGPATQMSVTELDPPQHTRIRTLVGGAFSARRAEQLRPYVREVADALLDELVAAGPRGDLLSDFCGPLTFAAQSELLGVTPSRRAIVRDCANARLGRPGSPRTEIYEGELLLHDEVSAMLADEQDPPSGLMAELISAHRDQGLLTLAELNGLATSLFFDGHALAAAQIGNAVLCVLSRPGLLRRMILEPDLAAGVTEESLRYSPAVNYSMTRVATADVDVAGVRIRPGEVVTAMLPVANRDRDTFDEAQSFTPGRTGARHLSFGHGTHHCIGAHLARVEIQVALQALARHVPRLELAVAENELHWTVAPTIRTLTGLPVRWNMAGPGRAAAAAA